MGFSRIALPVAPRSGRVNELPALRSIARPGGGHVASRQRTGPHEVSNLIVHLVGSRSRQPWLMISPRVPSRVAALREPSSG
jgi:hypothetical protein